MSSDFATRVTGGRPLAAPSPASAKPADPSRLAAVRDPASRASAPAPAAPSRDEVDALLVPPLRGRVRDALRFLLAAQVVYAALLVFAGGEFFVERLVVNAVRLGLLLYCVWALRGDGSRTSTLAIASVGLAGQLATGLAMSAVRGDTQPTVLVLIALTSVTAVYIPWGARVQGTLAAASAATLAAASALVWNRTGQALSFDTTVTILTSFGVTTWIAWIMERSRRTLETRLAEAHRTDQELAALRDQLERRVADRTEALEQANRELEGFSYTVSHDLRSPLRSITGFSQLLLDEHAPEMPAAATAHAAKIQAAARRMDGLIDAMLLLARVGRSTLRYETVNLSELARSIAGELLAENPDRRVEVVVEDIPLVPGDTALLRAALDNLLRNAFKFTATREVGRVTVSGGRSGDRVFCRVEDDGIGFDPALGERLFQPFERLHDDRRFRGTGVGLATVARIVRRHGGDVTAEGRPDRGAAFTLFLPAVRPPKD